VNGNRTKDDRIGEEIISQNVIGIRNIGGIGGIGGIGVWWEVKDRTGLNTVTA